MQICKNCARSEGESWDSQTSYDESTHTVIIQKVFRKQGVGGGVRGWGEVGGGGGGENLLREQRKSVKSHDEWVRNQLAQE
jgi:hypothetical protein